MQSNHVHLTHARETTDAITAPFITPGTFSYCVPKVPYHDWSCTCAGQKSTSKETLRLATAIESLHSCMEYFPRGASSPSKREEITQDRLTHVEGWAD